VRSTLRGRSGKRYLTPFPDPLTRPFALGLAVFIAIPMLKSHWGHGFFLAGPGEASGIEYTLVLFLIAMAPLIDGGGAFSVDRLLSR
jgi:putative oxidoreductase